MKSKTTRFLWASLAIILILSIAIFAWITMYMLEESRKTITQVGEIYMEEMTRQQRLHFSSIIDLRLSQVDGIIQRNPAGGGHRP